MPIIKTVTKAQSAELTVFIQQDAVGLLGCKIKVADRMSATCRATRMSRSTGFFDFVEATL
jgi:hypothetical protein